MRVAILAGGRSSEREVSLLTAAVVRDAVLIAGHEVVTIVIDRSGAWRSDGSRLQVCPGGGLLGCDVVFPALHGPFGEDGTVQGVLETLDVPYVGAGVRASSLCMDKAECKAALAASGVPQVRHLIVPERWWRRSPDVVEAEASLLGMPVNVAPARLRSPVGVVKVTGASRLGAALEAAFSYDGVAVIEEFCHGAEIECAVIGIADPETSVPGQVVLRGAGWHDHGAKHTRGGHTLAAPAEISDSVAGEVRRLARETFLRVGCSGLARVDFFVDGARVLVNEVDTLPGFTPTSDFPRLWAATGVELPALCERLLGFAIERFRTERRRRVVEER